MIGQIFTPEQVAQMLQIHHLTVLKLIKRGDLNASKVGRVYRIREREIDAYLNANQTVAA